MGPIPGGEGAIAAVYDVDPPWFGAADWQRSGPSQSEAAGAGRAGRDSQLPLRGEKGRTGNCRGLGSGAAAARGKAEVNPESR